MFKPNTATRFKRRLSLPDLRALTAVYALDFALLVASSPGLYLVGSWAFLVINLAVIILYAPQGSEFVLFFFLVASCLAAVLFAAPIAPSQPSSGSVQRW
ncbi:MAG: hypothetical protein P4L84_16955 [Isosphaeraceae bacterium]|nr:hypothetical protein [Isosphaeraceae bacterium]